MFAIGVGKSFVPAVVSVVQLSSFPSFMCSVYVHRLLLCSWFPLFHGRCYRERFRYDSGPSGVDMQHVCRQSEERVEPVFVFMTSRLHLSRVRERTLASISLRFRDVGIWSCKRGCEMLHGTSKFLVTKLLQCVSVSCSLLFGTCVEMTFNLARRDVDRIPPSIVGSTVWYL